MKRSFSLTFWIILALCNFTAVYAEEGVLVVHVTNTESRALSGIVLSPRGDGAVSSPTDRAGRTRIKLPPDTRPGKWVTLQIIESRTNKASWVFISPWDARVPVPSFDNEADNFVSVVLAKRSDKVLLENGRAIASITKSILSELASKPVEKRITEEERKAVLNEQAQKYGLKPEQIDQAIREWGEKSKDPFERGLASLYARQYKDATAQLFESLKVRKEELATSQAKIAESATFLGQCLFEQGRFREASEILQQAVDIHPDDIELLSNLGAALTSSSEYTKAELVLQKAVTLGESSPSVEALKLADALNSLGGLYIYTGRFSEAESVVNRAKTIIEQHTGIDPFLVASILNSVAVVDVLLGRGQKADAIFDDILTSMKKVKGANHPEVALALINEASFYIGIRQYDKAENLLKQARAIFDVLQIPSHPYLGIALFRLAFIYEAQNRYSESDPLYILALAIQEEALGAQHPDVAEALIGVAKVHIRRGEYEEAESKALRAINIWESSIGKQYYALSIGYFILAEVRIHQNKRAEAEPLLRRSVELTEKGLGPEHENVASYLNEEAVNYYKQDKYNEAKPLYLRAMTIWEKVAGPELQHPGAVICLSNLAKLYTKLGEYEEAERDFKRAITSGEKVLVSSPEDMAKILEGYAELLHKENREAEAENIENRIKNIRANDKHQEE